MELKILFSTQLCIHNNLSEWNIGRSLYQAVDWDEMEWQ